MAGEVDFAGEGFTGADFHGFEDRVSAGRDGVSVDGFDDEVEPLEAAVGCEEEFAAGVVGDGDGGEDGFSGEVFFFREPERGGELARRAGGERERDGREDEESAYHLDGGVAEAGRRVKPTLPGGRWREGVRRCV